MTTETDIKKQVNAALDEEISGQSASPLAERKKAERKKRRIRLLQGGGLVLFCYVAYLLFIPHKGGLNFGVCKVFLELYVRYPDTLNLSTVEDFGDSFRIWFTEVDASGQYRLEQMQCYYRPDENMGFALTRVSVDRRDVEQALVESFNRSIPVIAKFPPDLTLPAPIPDSLKDMEIDTDKFRRKIFQ